MSQNKSKQKAQIIQEQAQNKNEEQNQREKLKQMYQSQCWEDQLLKKRMLENITCENSASLTLQSDEQQFLNDKKYGYEQTAFEKNSKIGFQKQVSQLDEFNAVFKQKKVKLKKNNNEVKHFIRKFVQYYMDNYRYYFQNDPELLNEMKNFISKQKRKFREQKHWNNNLDAIDKIFGEYPHSFNPRRRSLLNRKMAHFLIQSNLIPEVLKNGQVKNKLEYIFTLKVQRLRSFNLQLLKRTKIH